MTEYEYSKFFLKKINDLDNSYPYTDTEDDVNNNELKGKEHLC